LKRWKFVTKAWNWLGSDFFRESTMPAKAAKKLMARSDPDPYVIVDFVFDRGLLSISIKNIGARPAFAVRVRFSHKLMGCAGAVDVSSLALFRALEFLPGGKNISTILDTSVSYFRSKQPVEITTDISYRDSRGNKFSNSIRHNLEIYRDIAYAPLPADTP
jgi:hypothetical protein